MLSTLLIHSEKLVDQKHAESQRAHVQSNTVHDQLAEDGLSNADLLVSIRKKSNREVKGKVTLGTHTAKSHICEEVLPIAAVIIRDAIRLYSNNQAPVISPMITTTRFSQLRLLLSVIANKGNRVYSPQDDYIL